MQSFLPTAASHNSFRFAIVRGSFTKSARDAWGLWAFIVCLNQLVISLQRTSFNGEFYALPELVLLHKLFLVSRSDLNYEVLVFDITDELKMSRSEVRQLITQLEEEELLIKVVEKEEPIIVSLTENGRFQGNRLMQILH